MPAFLITVSCGNNGFKTSETAADVSGAWDRGSAEREYRSLMARIDLANIGRPYLILDFNSGSLAIMLKGALIWDCRMNIDPADSLKVGEFESRFRGERDRLIRPLAGKHLYKAAEKISDSTLVVIGEAVKVDPKLLQRDLPERFLLIWDDGLIAEIYTDIHGSPISFIRNTIEEIRQTISSPFGETDVVMKMDPDDALTLYRASEKGMMTMVLP